MGIKDQFQDKANELKNQATRPRATLASRARSAAASVRTRSAAVSARTRTATVARVARSVASSRVSVASRATAPAQDAMDAAEGRFQS